MAFWQFTQTSSNKVVWDVVTIIIIIILILDVYNITH